MVQFSLVAQSRPTLCDPMDCSLPGSSVHRIFQAGVLEWGAVAFYARQQKRHRCIEQYFGLRGRGQGWDDLGEWHWNMYNMYNDIETWWNELPVQVPCMTQDAQGWCTGMTQRDVVGREVWGGFMFGIACTPVVDSCQCMAKPIQHRKVKINR